MSSWDPIKYETLEWINTGDLQYISRRSRSKILPEYKSSLPNTIFDKDISIPSALEGAIADLMVNISRFDARQNHKGFSFPTILLRSESAASSQIENLTSSIRNIALAELSDKSPYNAKLIAGNVSAMRAALEISEPISKEVILNIHEKLLLDSQDLLAGEFRNEPVWIGGTSYSPHEAIFVPPHQSHIEYYMDDLIKYAQRIDLNPIVKAAIIHAQFETIHPFIDGNGRTGRTLIHKSLKDDGVLETVALPISSGLLTNTKEYMDALIAYQNGNPILIIEQVFLAIELSLVIGNKVSQDITEVIERWESIIQEKKNSSIWEFLYILIDQPVVDSKYVSDALNISVRGANKLIGRAISYGIIRKIGNAHRGVFYQSDEIIKVLDQISDSDKIKRNFY